MKKQDYTACITVNATAAEAFKCINNIKGWWTEDIEGSLKNGNDIFTVRFGEVFITSKITELIPGKKIVWQVIDCNKPWLKNKQEWNGTKMSWEISAQGNKTAIHFAHIGLVPEIECFDVCSKAWGEYLQQSLLSLINTGKGQPTKTAEKKKVGSVI